MDALLLLLSDPPVMTTAVGIRPCSMTSAGDLLTLPCETSFPVVLLEASFRESSFPEGSSSREPFLLASASQEVGSCLASWGGFPASITVGVGGLSFALKPSLLAWLVGLLLTTLRLSREK